MRKVSVTLSFDAAHRISGHAGLCHNLHGHTYQVEVVIQGPELDQMDMLIDFKSLKPVIKDIVMGLDHSLMLCSNSEIDIALGNAITSVIETQRIVWFELRPTVENLSEYIYNRIRDDCRHKGAAAWRSLSIAYVKVSETPSTWASYDG